MLFYFTLETALERVNSSSTNSSFSYLQETSRESFKPISGHEKFIRQGSLKSEQEERLLPSTVVSAVHSADKVQFYSTPQWYQLATDLTNLET
jgi:hypothetical protein